MFGEYIGIGVVLKLTHSSHSAQLPASEQLQTEETGS